MTEPKKRFYAVHIFLFPFKCIFGNQKYAKICRWNMSVNVVTIDALASFCGTNIWGHANTKWKQMETTTPTYRPELRSNIYALIVEGDINTDLVCGNTGRSVIRSLQDKVTNFSQGNRIVI